MTTRRHWVTLGALFVSLAVCSASAPQPAADIRWSPEKAKAWSRDQGWLVGANYAPASAINQLEMWQADTFDPGTIDRELGWAEGLGFNIVRVFLHDILWTQDSEGFLKRMDQFLEIADRHGIGAMFVLFDGVWNPLPKPGPQPAPRPHVHNSGWVQSPGAEILSDPKKIEALKPYVVGVVGRFRDDRRVKLWDVFNEPDNDNKESYGKSEIKNKAEMSLVLLKQAFAWAREAKPSQPLTAAPWKGGDWSDPAKLGPMETFMLEQSDIISFHSYSPLAEVRQRVAALEKYGRPIICSEYMARSAGSTFESILPFFKEKGVGAINWGFVSGKTQTIYPWDSWRQKYTESPKVWFHDIFRQDGTPYDPSEVALIKRLTGKT
jgi:hypothetical protein